MTLEASHERYKQVVRSSSQPIIVRTGSPLLPELWGEEEPLHEVKAYQPDTLTEYSE